MPYVNGICPGILLPDGHNTGCGCDCTTCLEAVEAMRGIKDPKAWVEAVGELEERKGHELNCAYLEKSDFYTFFDCDCGWDEILSKLRAAMGVNG